MTEKNAAEWGKQAAGQWVLDGTISAKTIARQGQADLSALFALCGRLDRAGDESNSAQWLLDQLWLLRREGEDAAGAVRSLGRLPAVRSGGRCARTQLLGETLAQDCAQLTRETLLEFLEGVQSVTPLDERELSAVLPCVKLGILHQVREIAGQLEEAQTEEQLRQCFDALRMLSGQDFSKELEGLSAVHQIFSQDETYLQMDQQGRQTYRCRLAQLARRQGQPEGALAQQYLDEAQKNGKHIGYLLYPRQEDRGRWYPQTMWISTAALTLLLGWQWGSWWAALLAVLPISELVKQVVDFAALHIVSPRPVFRLELKEGIPREGKTLCVISVLLADDNASAELAARLERYYLANRSAGESVNYGILADLPDSQTPPGQEERARVAAAKARMDQLNKKYPGRFYLFTREPVYVPKDDCYRGRERKRGALMELLSLLRGVPSELEVTAGEPSGLGGTAFLLTLDSDTLLNVDSVRRLVGAMLHPLNRPVVDEKRKVVTEGYGLLQPRIVTNLNDANATRFAALFCGPSGRDPNTAAAADLYHDLFDRGSYCGKGILDVEAAAKCLTGRFPENRILSHDLLEGAFLRVGFCAGVELTDGFPHSVESYFRRQHRWVRGDWQAARWMGLKAPNQAGRKIVNPVTTVDRWKLFDNLRRSLLPVALLVNLVGGALGTEWVFRPLVWLSLGALGAGAVLSGLELTLRRFRGSRQRVFSRIYDGLSGAILQMLIRLVLLPCEAWVNGSAICTALWRMLVTHRGLLDWTVSAQARTAGRFWAPGIGAGLLLLLLSPGPGGRAVGLVWLLSPFLLRFLSEERKEETPFTPRERAFLTHQAQLIWRYFDTWLRPEDHYLPPDNVQELPSVGPARRTSPTNIGLALLACLAAVDLGVAEREQAVEKIRLQLDTLEKLEKWQGHLYNWYDTEAAAPLYPRYVSTVDSGNLCGSLIALEQGLLEFEETELAARAKALAEGMRFAPLYDEDRDLFYIGYDAEQGQFTDSWYDLLASEARQTSFLAVARGEVPPRHWGRLSRVMTSKSHRFGLASWSGTMFEYFMPHLLLPVERNSLLYESLAFCAWVQKRWGERLKQPWGVSESAYNRLDQHQNYQYKAHGVPPLGLQRKLELERVTAPYATFLALEFLPHSGVENLRRLCALGAEGKYGLCEAVDFTPERTDGRPMVIRSWMVHHLGMSLLAVDNALNGQIMRRRFMAEPAMEAHWELLQERIPLGLVPPKKLKIKVKRDKMDEIKQYLRTGQGFDPAAPACHLLASGKLAHAVTAEAGGALCWDKFLLIGPMEARFRTEEQEWRLAPAGQGRKELRWRFSDGQAEVSLQKEEISFRQQITLNESGQLRELTVTARVPGTLELCVIPILDESGPYEAHRAFSRLSLNVREIAGGAVVSRRPREGKEYPNLVLLWDGGGTLSITENCVVKLTVPIPQGEASLRLALAAGEEAQAYHAAQGLLIGARSGHTDEFCSLSTRYHLKEGEQRQLDELTSRLLWPRSLTGTPKGQSALWPYGISGDLPIWTVFASGKECVKEELCIRQWAALRGCGLRFDLVFFLPEGRIGQEMAGTLTESCKGLQLTDFIGARGGLHFITATAEAVEAVSGMSEMNGLPREPENQFDLPPLPPEARYQGGVPTWRWEGNTFVIETNGGLLPRRWSQILTNGAFGWTADDCGTGHLWSGNAHENKLTPWENDPYAHRGPEQLFVLENGQETALFAANDGMNAVIRYGAGFASWEKRWEGKRVSVTAFVPPACQARVFLIHTEGFGPEARLRWRVSLQMSPHLRGRHYVTVRSQQGAIVAENPANTEYPGEQLFFQGSRPLELVEQPNNYTFTAQLPVEGELVLIAGLEKPCAITGEVARQRLEETIRHWEREAAFLTVRTPDEALNHYLSFWGRYQTIACRLLARTALYQCGGAYGFRDQLQDACGLLPNGKALVREQILRCCRHQYQEGDVQHWWHPLPSGERGVRTRISDDLLWLPYALCRWVSVTGDRTLLEKTTPWLTSKPLQKGERERYEEAAVSKEQDTVFDHCVRAIECCLGRGVGEHGLCLMGTGDWNDGMDRLGQQGRGESVWLTWFLSLVLEEFTLLCEGERKERYQKLSAQLAQKADQAWDGGWYRRAYDDTGHPVGSRENNECKIDSIAQSFSVFAPNPSPERARQGVQAAIDRLYNRSIGTVALLDPPFREETGVGYISAYPAGIRENGGQYTHAAVWLAMAAFRMGDREQGWQMLQSLLPEHSEHVAYQGEPYVLAGDVSTAPGKEGRAGWTWYTGAASWYCRCAVEELLGLRVRGNRLYVMPDLPRDWHGYDADWTLEGATLHLHVTSGKAEKVVVNGKTVSQGIPLDNLTGEVDVQVTFVRKPEGR